ncbi:hypothetical protein BC941DRAFT_422807 [Chlamydoabsidia padenii]|nr:hypothetical protein BC941DRAFT_422807 [Chlamydoabsidia padenii]
MMYPSSNPNADTLNFAPPWLGTHPLTGRRLSNNTSYSYDPLGTSFMDDDEFGRDTITTTTSQLQQQQQQQQSSTLPVSSWNTVPSYELALFSFVSPDMPSIATLPFLLYYLHDQDDLIHTATNMNPSTRYSTATAAATAAPMMANTFMPGPLLINPPPIDYWKLRSLQLTMFLLGCVSAMLQVFLFVYLYDCLDLPMMVIGLTGSCIILSEIVLLTTVTKWIHGMNLTGMTTLIHATLIVCSFSFLWLRPYHAFTTVAAFILPLLQSGVFYLAWLVTSDRINTLVWSDSQRIFQRAILSTLFCTLGPMVGVILTGYLISDDLQPSSFASVYHASIGLSALSFVVSWGWSTDE